jgi:5'-3' exonuclease
MKVHLVDGTFELFRCFHAAPRARAGDGREIGAARGLLQTFVKLLRQPDVTHVAIAFDAVVPPTAKGGTGDADLIREQTHLAADVVRALGVLLWPLIRFQVDDALATGAARFRDAPGVEQVVICSTDKDFAQCVVGRRVVVLDRIRDHVLDEDGVVAKFGVPPARIPEYFALVGDPSDGLPGLPGFGAKSTAVLLQRYASLEAIPDDAAAWDVTVRGAARLAETLRERRREAYLYRNLSVLRTDVPLPDELEHLAWRGARREKLEALAEYLGEQAVLERAPRWRE